MRVLFIHQNCPGQYKHLSRVLASRPGNQAVFITQKGKPEVPGVRKFEYEPNRQPSPKTHYYIRNFEGGILNGQAVARVAVGLKNRGFTPDIVCAHPGWGESLYIKDVYPDVPLLNYCEFFYRQVGSDVGFDPEYPLDLDTLARVRTRNALHLLSIEACDQGISPTLWQRAQFPKEFHYKIATCHDGVDTDIACPDPDATVRLPDGTTLNRQHEVVTYVARNLEPYRGFPSFMKAVAEICKRRPHCHVLVVGGDNVSYGRRLPDGKTYREKMLSEVEIDPKRVTFAGRVSYANFIKVLQVSSVHVYLTYPFVLSWSMLEAMAAGCLVVGSDTAPVTEILSDGKNGLLVDFFSPGAIADRVDEVLDHKDRMADLRERARQTILERYRLEDCLKQQVRLMEELCAGKRPRFAEVRADHRQRPAKKGSASQRSAKRAQRKQAQRTRRRK